MFKILGCLPYGKEHYCPFSITGKDIFAWQFILNFVMTDHFSVSMLCSYENFRKFEQVELVENLPLPTLSTFAQFVAIFTMGKNENIQFFF